MRRRDEAATANTQHSQIRLRMRCFELKLEELRITDYIRQSWEIRYRFRRDASNSGGFGSVHSETLCLSLDVENANHPTRNNVTETDTYPWHAQGGSAFARVTSFWCMPMLRAAQISLNTCFQVNRYKLARIAINSLYALPSDNARRWRWFMNRVCGFMIWKNFHKNIFGVRFWLGDSVPASVYILFCGAKCRAYFTEFELSRP